MGEQLRELADVGQSIWLDNIRRSMFASGELQRLIDLGLRGMTSNPTIFEKATGSGSDYDEQLRTLVDEADPVKVFEAIAIRDIRSACDLFHAVWEQTDGLDGYVSLEVSPTLARDTQGTIDAAQRLWREVNRRNLMIKIPGTAEGVPAIKATIAAGINVNVTLLFSVDRYEAAANAYIEGLEERAATGQPIDRIASVASFFVSRIDNNVDKLLQARIDKGEHQLEPLLGKAAIANTKLAYQRFLKLFGGDRFGALKAKGAHVQRPLWASTSTKNPAYPDLMYVENLIGHDTVNTVPPNTLEALLDHGQVRADTVLEDLDGARGVIEALAKAQISLYDVTETLVADGVKSFADSFNAMLDAITGKLDKLREGAPPRVGVSAPGGLASAIDAELDKLGQSEFLRKLWTHDPSPWSADPAHVEIIKHALGWVEIAQQTHAQSGDLRDFAHACAKRYEHVVVLGMGGSSLAPDILRATFGKTPGYPSLHVLDSTDTQQLKALDDSLDIAKSLFVVSSKSGTTTEPEAFFRYFFQRVQQTVGASNAGDHFVAVTDPGTKLEQEAKDNKFLRVFTNDANIGGRYSALSYFGMVPAALAGYDVTGILDRAINAMHANAATVAAYDAPGMRFGAAIGSLAKSGRDKLTIIAHPAVKAFGAWAEQLIAESTGKSGTGIVPVDGEPLGAANVYGNDRVFVYVGEGLPGDDPAFARLAELESAGHPVIRLVMNDTLDIGEQFYTWEIATAAAGAVLGIDAFDQPNVQESKDNTKRLLAEFTAEGKFSEPEPRVRTDGALVYPLSGSRASALGADLQSAVAAVAEQIKAGDYVAFNAYLPMDADDEAALLRIRTTVRDALHVATTVGFGPRFLHSTGQLHKGGPNEGVFFQVTYDPPFDSPIPGMVGFRTLQRAQALGDFESLDKRDRRGIRIHFPGDPKAGLAALASALEAAVSARA
ncbi:MAG: transaldolase / glucose-6-phosphate isomerase [Candidatus Eremiobacteraeota bacterium]|jgi:transaldolase/glucose-6-phosphate isomerase|nr:transaldolase / glucose-6-phosphate isomerase [Candidatus Eremiobacteraeota bacterium]